jgi:hypothetical protein
MKKKNLTTKDTKDTKKTRKRRKLIDADYSEQSLSPSFFLSSLFCSDLVSLVSLVVNFHGQHQ